MYTIICTYVYTLFILRNYLVVMSHIANHVARYIPSLCSYKLLILLITYVAKCQFIFTATSKDLIDHFSHYLTTEMDSDLIVEHMLSRQLLKNQEVHTIISAASSFQRNCLILEKIRLMDIKSLVSFYEILQMFDCQNHIANVLLNGK